LPPAGGHSHPPHLLTHALCFEELVTRRTNRFGFAPPEGRKMPALAACHHANGCSSPAVSIPRPTGCCPTRAN